MRSLKRIAKKLNIADCLSIYRIIAVPVLGVVIKERKRKLTGILLMVSFLTDAVDGFIARKMEIQSNRGAVLDSIGDLLTIVTGLTAVYKMEDKFFEKQYKIIAVPAALYLLQMIIALVKFKKFSSYHAYSAKVTAILLSVFLVKSLLRKPDKALFYITISSAVLEAIEETAITLKLNEPKKNIKSIFYLIWNR